MMDIRDIITKISYKVTMLMEDLTHANIKHAMKGNILGDTVLMPSYRELTLDQHRLFMIDESWRKKHAANPDVHINRMAWWVISDIGTIHAMSPVSDFVFLIKVSDEVPVPAFEIIYGIA